MVEERDFLAAILEMEECGVDGEQALLILAAELEEAWGGDE